MIRHFSFTVTKCYNSYIKFLFIRLIKYYLKHTNVYADGSEEATAEIYEHLLVLSNGISMSNSAVKHLNRFL